MSEFFREIHHLSLTELINQAEMHIRHAYYGSQQPSAYSYEQLHTTLRQYPQGKKLTKHDLELIRSILAKLEVHNTGE